MNRQHLSVCCAHMSTVALCWVVFFGASSTVCERQASAPRKNQLKRGNTIIMRAVRKQADSVTCYFTLVLYHNSMLSVNPCTL